MLRKIDSKPIYFKYVIGNSSDNSKPVYSNLQIAYGHIIDDGGDISIQPYGLNIEYDKRVILNYVGNAKFINDKTAIYLEEVPTDLFINGDYEIVKIEPPKLGIINLYLRKIKGISLPYLYFEHENEILSTQLNFDKNTLIGYVPKNEFITFDETTKIWTRKVNDTSITRNMIKLVGKELYNNLHYKLTFIRV